MQRFNKNYFYTTTDFTMFLYDFNFSDETVVFVLNNLDSGFCVNLILSDKNFENFINRFSFYDIINKENSHYFYGIKLVGKNFIKGVNYANRKRKKICS